MKNIMQSGPLPKYSSSSVLIPPCKWQNLVVAWCRMTVLSYFEVHNDPTWMNIGFSISILSREDGKWRKGAIKCSRGHLAVNIAWCKASCCAEQPPVSMGGSDQRYRTRRKAGCLGRKQEFIFESGVWTYILCNLWRADTWSGESNYFYFYF